MSYLNNIHNSLYQTGENMSLEYKWGSDVQELFTQLYFQISNNININQIVNIKNIFKIIIEKCYLNIIKNNYFNYYFTILENCFKLIINTRCISKGKGLYKLAFSLLSTWCSMPYDFFYETSKKILEIFVNYETNIVVGSWKDIKYFINHLYYNENFKMNHKIITFAFNLVIDQLILDLQKSVNDNISLVAKWIPREKSKKFGWQTIYFAVHYYYKINNKKVNINMIIYDKKFSNYILKKFRLAITYLNKKLNTLEIELSKNPKCIITETNNS